MKECPGVNSKTSDRAGSLTSLFPHGISTVIENVIPTEFAKWPGLRMSHALYSFAHSPQVLQEFVDTYKCGWFDGGCFVFAYGLQLWLGGRLAIIVRKHLYCEQTFDHCFLSVPDPLGTAEPVYIDANGASSRKEFLRYWRTYENLAGAILEDPVDKIRLVGHLEND